ncbi:MAG: hypothetical protein PF517_19260 [Salinivirgaceae bacterium]|jgi:hypothetical protein|nr:hypothetical protein [Salinivirgaceae bacterium]
MIIKKVTKTEMNLIRSRALVALFGMLLGTLLLLPIITSARDGKKPENTAKLYIQALQSNKHAAVSIFDLGEGKHSITIESDSKESVYYDNVLKNPESFAKIFDFSNLEDGEYVLKVKSKNNVKTREFEIVKGKIKVFYEETVQPEFTINGEKATLKLNNTDKLTYSLRVINENGTELSSVSENDASIKKVFDFSTAKPGSYKIVASSNKTDFSFNYSK